MRFIILTALVGLSPAAAFAEGGFQSAVPSEIYRQLQDNEAQVFARALPNPVVVVRADGGERVVNPGALDLLEGRYETEFGRIVSFACKDAAANVVSCVAIRSLSDRMTFRTDFEFSNEVVSKVLLFAPVEDATNG